MQGYWLIMGSAIADQAAQEEYGRLWAPIAARYGARLVKDAPALELKEGQDIARMILVAFPDVAIARACYADPDYGVAMVQALKASRRTLVIVEGDLG